MATASEVDIKISVDSAQAISGVQNVKKEFDGFSMTMTQAEQDAQRLGNTMDLTGSKLGQAGEGMRTMSGHAATSLDSVRLLSQEFGLRMPRAIEAMLSRMPGVTQALGSIIGIMGGIAAVEIFSRAIEGGIKFYNEIFDVNAAMREYLEKAGQAENTKFIDEASIETASASLESLNAQIDKLDQRRVASGVDQSLGGMTQYLDVLARNLPGAPTDIAADPHYSKADGANRAKDAQAQAEEDQRVHELKRQYDEEDLKNQAKLNEAGLAGAALIAQKQKDAHAANAAAQQQELQRELDQQKTMQAQRALQIQMGVKDPAKLVSVPFVDQNAGGEARKRADSTADIEAMTQSAALNKEMQMDIMKANDQRVQAGLQGEALYFEKMRADVRELTLELEQQGKAAEIPARVREINEKYFDDLSERMVKAQNESGSGVRKAQAAGQTGASRIYADQDIAVNENNVRFASDPEQEHTANVAAAQEANQKIAELQKQFSEQMGQISDAQVDRTLNGYARIDAAAQKQVDRVNDDYSKSFGGAGVDQNSGPALPAQQAKQKAITAIETDAEAQRSQLSQANRAEDLKYDQDAMQAESKVRSDGAMGWVASYQNAVAEINAQEQQRLAKLTEDSAKEGLTAQETAQRRTDIVQSANAEIAAQAEDLQHKIAGTLESAFKDPVGTIKSMMEKMFMDILSGWIAHLGIFKGVFGQALGGITPGGGAQQGSGVVAGMDSAAGSIVSGGSHAVAGIANIGTASTPSVAQSTTQFRHAYTGSAAGSASSAPASVAANLSSASSGAHSASPSIGGVLSTAHSLSGLVTHSASTPSAGNSLPVQSPSGTTDSTGMLSLSGNGTMDAAPDPTTPNIGNGLPGSFSGTASTVAGGTSGALSTAMGIAGAGAAAYSGVNSTVNAFETGNALQGGLSDASAGAAIGTVVGGPVGAAIGAGIGAAVGLAAGALGAVTGMAGKMQARDYYNNSVFPQLEAERQSPTTGGISDVDREASSAYSYMQVHFGADPADWVKSQYMDKEVASVVAEITNRAKGGAGYIGASAAEFHMGGYVSDFGDLATSSSEGFAKLLLGESVNTQQATSLHAPVINAMNSGASPSDVASMYLNTVKPSGGANTGAQSGGDTHIHVHTLDTKTMTGWLRGGGARMITKEQNNFAGQYAGDGIVG